jgi:hypothetical protein
VTARRMFRYVVPVDDGMYPFVLWSSPVAVAAHDDGKAVEFWAENGPAPPGVHAVRRWFQVFGTGDPLPEDARWVGTCPRTPAGLVWHLFERDKP